MKTTWLWLKNLPLLEHTNVLGKPEPTRIEKSGKKRYFSDSKIRDPKARAKFWPGIASAMAEQWTEYITQIDIKNEIAGQARNDGNRKNRI